MHQIHQLAKYLLVCIPTPALLPASCGCRLRKKPNFFQVLSQAHYANNGISLTLSTLNTIAITGTPNFNYGYSVLL
jgi:hypothetical protein